MCLHLLIVLASMNEKTSALSKEQEADHQISHLPADLQDVQGINFNLKGIKMYSPLLINIWLVKHSISG